MKLRLRIVCACCWLLLFFQPAYTQDVSIIRSKVCDDQPAGNDPSIRTNKSVDSTKDCKPAAEPSSLWLVDLRYGFVLSIRSPHGVAVPPKVIAPDAKDPATMLKQCLLVYPSEATVVEWLVPHGTECKGRGEGSSIYRLYTPQDDICLMPSRKCVKASQLKPEAQDRFKAMLRTAYSGN